MSEYDAYKLEQQCVERGTVVLGKKPPYLIPRVQGKEILIGAVVFYYTVMAVRDIYEYPYCGQQYKKNKII